MRFFSVGKPDSSEVVSVTALLTVSVCFSEMKKKMASLIFFPLTINTSSIYKLKEGTNTVTATMLVWTLVHNV